MRDLPSSISTHRQLTVRRQKPQFANLKNVSS